MTRWHCARLLGLQFGRAEAWYRIAAFLTHRRARRPSILYQQTKLACALLVDVTETTVTIELRKARPRGLEPPTTGSTVRLTAFLTPFLNCTYRSPRFLVAPMVALVFRETCAGPRIFRLQMTRPMHS